MFSWLIVIATTGTSAILFASFAECFSHKAVFTSLIGAVGGGLGQYVGRSLSVKLAKPNDVWLSQREFSRLYKSHLITAKIVWIAGVLFGFLIGFAMNYVVDRW
jgi:hypothetical protein